MVSSEARSETEDFSTREAAVLSEMKEKRLRRLVREMRMGRQSKQTRRRILHFRDVFFLALARSLPPFDRRTGKDLYSRLSKSLTERGAVRGTIRRVAFGDRVTLDASRVHAEVRKRVGLFRSAGLRITTSPATMGGEPVFKGTRVSVAHVGALAARGIPLTEILEDYPRLKPRDVEMALLIHRLGRRPGRPRKPIELRR